MKIKENLTFHDKSRSTYNEADVKHGKQLASIDLDILSLLRNGYGSFHNAGR